MWEQPSWPTAAGIEQKELNLCLGWGKFAPEEVPSPKQRAMEKENWLFIKGLAQKTKKHGRLWGSETYGDFGSLRLEGKGCLMGVLLH